MDPGRREMMAKKARSNHSQNITRPRADHKTRVAKRDVYKRDKDKGKASRYLTADQQSLNYVADEDRFVLKQSKKKADIRVREGRAMPIDRLAFNLRYMDKERDVFDDDDDDIQIELQAPETIVEQLATDQLDQLQSDMESLLVLEADPTNRQYWEALQALCKDQKSKLGPQGREDRVLSSVAEDIDRILKPKTHDQLEALETQIKAKLRSNEDIDTDYWEQLLRNLVVWKSKATLRRIFQTAVEAREKLLKEKRSSGKQGGEQQQPRSSTQLSVVPRPIGLPDKPGPPPPAPAPGGRPSDNNEDASQATKALYDREAARGISENEEIFTAEEAVPAYVKPRWVDRRGARKPRYFNRVQMGYEWNKYNQTHYDHDNPPPKVVQGYKFNIFYPELEDKTKAPTFKIIREHGRRRGQSHAAAGEADTCLIHFIAGPPYEDIAFRIVDREWDFSAKRERGFRSTFDRGILQLHFQFKKIFYRK
ncbi:hypothetical protein L249_0484 [Ophiocordyceps polyrhachis-furcata BCC 54312]|uniref:Splicing factor Cactin n=1 Tax=Ophiocordyceps polyrhachis-furcata BCC 54312 TaxID=1330021 RepID=A0A367LEY3_9HYPO|nr:hypothetical protein L249_0484 [Ophiocordyceps polyrhachis-furcata BCC 54312]